jgi:hypothetical protein
LEWIYKNYSNNYLSIKERFNFNWTQNYPIITIILNNKR